MGPLHRDHGPLVGRAVLPDGLGHDDDPAGLAGGVADGLLVERADGPDVDDLDEMPSGSSSWAASMACQTMYPEATTVTSSPARFTSHRLSGSTYSASGTSPRNAYRSLCSRKITGLSSRMAAFMQALGVVGGRGQDDLEARDVGEPHLEALGVLGGRALARPSALRHAQHPGHPALPAGHEPQLRRLGGDLVHGQAGEVHEHDLGDRPHADEGRARWRPPRWCSPRSACCARAPGRTGRTGSGSPRRRRRAWRCPRPGGRPRDRGPSRRAGPRGWPPGRTARGPGRPRAPGGSGRAT